MLIEGTFASESLVGSSGGDTLDGSGGQDSLFGNQGNDLLLGGTGNDFLNGGQGNDLFALQYFNNFSSIADLDIVTDFVQGQDLIDVSALGISDLRTLLALSSNSNGNVIFNLQFRQLDDVFYSLRINGLRKNQLRASDFKFGNNTQARNVQGTTLNDDLFGALGNDTLDGSSGNDRLFGDRGRDLFLGGVGDDVFYGGQGSDLFALQYFDNFTTSGDVDTVADFVQGQDKIDVSGRGISDFRTMLALARNDANGNVVFKLQFDQVDGASYDLKINGLSKTQLRASDFRYSNDTQSRNLQGKGFNDDLFGALGNDTLDGASGNDRLFGDRGRDLFLGGVGDDVFYGGQGSDLFALQYFDNLITSGDLDTVADFVQGQDKIDVSGRGISDFRTMLALARNDANGNVVFKLQFDQLDGASYDLKINGLSKAQLRASDFRYSNDTQSRNLQGNGFNDDLFGALGNDTLDGGERNDRLFGDRGQDLLLGGLGNDFLYGGRGNDLFALQYFNSLIGTDDIDIVADFVQGQDKIDVSGLDITSFNTILAITNNDANGDAQFKLQFRQSNGNFYTTTIDGLRKNQLRARDFKFSNKTRNKTLQGTAFNDYLFGALGDDTFVAGDGNDRLFGQQGNDALIGSYNSDILYGGSGRDVFGLEYFQDAEDRFIDLAAALGLKWSNTLELFALIQALGFDAIDQIDIITDFVQGQDKIDVSLMGISDFNTLMAISENDGNGNVLFKSRYFHRTNDDFYTLRVSGITKNQLRPNDFIFSSNNARQNVLSTVYRDDLFGGLGSDSLNGSLGSDRLFGEQGNDTLKGGSGSDTLYGGTGSDLLIGDFGSDLYYVDNINDRVIETARIGGIDTIISSVNYTLPANVERLILTGNGNLNITGDNLDNRITGNNGNNSLQGRGGNNSLIGNGGNDRLTGQNGNDRLVGGSGADILIGGNGRDNLTGGAGADSFRYDSRNEGLDTITDFSVPADRFIIRAAGFGGGLSAGVLKANQFTFGSSAQDPRDRFIYNRATGALFFDRDGTGTLAQQRIAKLDNGLNLTNADFLVI